MSGGNREGRGPGDPAPRPVPDPEADRADEIRHHIQERADALVAEGWSEDDALREARRRFGDVAEVRQAMARADEEGAISGVVGALASLASDVRHAFRGFRLNPGFAGAVVATLALGIGAATAIFGVVDAVLLRPLAFRDPGTLFEVHRSFGGQGTSAYADAELFQAWRGRADDAVDEWVALAIASEVRVDGDRPEELAVLGVTPGAAAAVGLPLLMGREFGEDDAVPGAPPVAVLSRDYWERTGADRSVLGSTIRFDDGPVTVVGVLRDRTRFPTWGIRPDLWLPIRRDGTVGGQTPDRLPFQLRVRVRAGLDQEAAQARLDAVARGLSEADPEGNWGVALRPLGWRRATADVQRALWMLSVTVGLILVVALVNGVNLILVRTTSRRRELGVRAALGGSRVRLLRQLLVEGGVLAIAGGALALLLAWAGTAALGAVLPSSIQFWAPFDATVLGPRAVLFALALSAVAASVLTLAPARPALRSRRLVTQGAGAGESRSARRLRRVLVGVQVALSMTLLAGAGLFVHGFAKLMSVDTGYDVARLVTADLALSERRYPTQEGRADFTRRLDEALENHPAFVSASVDNGAFFSWGSTVEAEGAAGGPVAQPDNLPARYVAPDWIDVLGVEIVSGRGFTPSDAGRPVAVVDQDFARWLWPGEGAVGRRFRLGEGDWTTVVGVVRELRLFGRDQRDGPYQILRPRADDVGQTALSVTARTAGDPEAALLAFREVLATLDPEQPVRALRTGAQALAEAEDAPRFLVALMSVLATTAVALACVGLYGVLAYSVRRRERELGVRLALGADAGGLRRMVVRDGVAVAAVGVVVGLGGALAAARVVESLLYEVDPRDPFTLLATGMLFLGVAVVSSLLPARRATRVDPVRVLRSE